jgi:hypothetical protein
VPWARAGYRGRQFLHALFPRLDPEHIAQARAILGEGEMALFVSMEKRDQRHGLRVLHHLIDAGEDDRDLLAAALIHDCGKGRVSVWLRVLKVVAPWFVRELAAGTEGGESSTDHEWCATKPEPAVFGLIDRTAAYRLVHHDSIGAGMAERAGSSEATVRFISGGAAEHERAKMSSLRAADDRS